jgi:hypothetical protein
MWKRGFFLIQANCHQISLLRERIEQDYANFKNETIQLDSVNVFELASLITAINDVHLYMITHDWADAEQTKYLLQVENPLKLLAEEWEAYKEDMGKNFGDMLSYLSANWDEDYVSGTAAGEMKEESIEDEPFDMDDYF